MSARILLLPLLPALIAVALIVPLPLFRPPDRAGESLARLAASGASVEASLSALPALAVGAAPDDPARQEFARAAELRRLGEPDAAVAALQPLLGHAEPETAAEAAYWTALVRLEQGYPKESAGLLEGLLSRAPAGPLADRATFLLAMARRQADDCPGSIDALNHYRARASLLASQASFQLASCYQQLGDTGAALARLDDALQQTESRRLRIEATERQAAILEKAGDRAAALERYEQLVDLARDRNYRSDVRLAAARLNQELGRPGAAAAHLAAVVDDAPTGRNAVTALDRLVALNAADRVSYYQAGLVRYYARAYAAAIRNFEGALATPAESANHAAAAYFRAASRVRDGAELEGAADLLALPGRFPASAYAPDALVRGGKVFESHGQLTSAIQAYRRAATDYPASPFASEALFRIGFISLLRGSPEQASAAWGELAASDAARPLRAQALLWQGKLASQAGDQTTAQARWQAAVDVGPSSYGGLRARGLLDGSADILARPRPLDPARIEPTRQELDEFDAWLASHAASLDALVGEQTADPALARADDLLALGLNTEAAWELDDLTAKYAGDPARLAGLSLALHGRALDNAAIKLAQNALDAAKLSPGDAPIVLRKLLYPLPYRQFFDEQSSKRGVNPLLMASLVRQESHFEPKARSSADARGLTQVMPATGQAIAGALNRPDFKVEDLFKPSVSLEFGAFYFGDRLKRFDGAVFPALAAYNAGDGAVLKWIRDYGLEDIDAFAEQVPYAETNHYLKVIFENYGHYQSLYGRAP